MSSERAAEVSERSDKDTDRTSDPDHTFAFLFAVGRRGSKATRKRLGANNSNKLSCFSNFRNEVSLAESGRTARGKGRGTRVSHRTRPPHTVLTHLIRERLSLSRCVAKGLRSLGRRFDPPLSVPPVALEPEISSNISTRQHSEQLDKQSAQGTPWQDRRELVESGEGAR